MYKYIVESHALKEIYNRKSKHRLFSEKKKNQPVLLVNLVMFDM